MANPATRIGFIQFAFFAGLAAVVVRAAQLQIVQGRQWARVADSTRTASRELQPRRGTIYDRDGVPLAVSQEFYRVGVATWEVPERLRPKATRLLIRELKFEPAEVRAKFRRARQPRDYLYRFQPASASAVEELRDLKGVHLEPAYLRAYPTAGLARDLIGAVVADSGRGKTGIERSLDSLLTGVPGRATYLRDRAGREYLSPDRVLRLPVPGHDVYLTLDAELQGIAEAGLAETLEEQDASAGDVVLLEPRTGEVLALATRVRRPDGARKAGAWIPAEPGSTIKPFAAAALLQLGRARATDSVHAENGEWRLPRRSRPIRDDHPKQGYLTLARAIEVSSNVATAKFTLKLKPEEHYDVLRDFGFGSPTALELPYESPGLLKRPDRWQVDNTQPSMAQGYELEVTPLQLAAAYAALANDGLLPALSLIREIRDRDGGVVYRHEPRPVRRVVSPEVAAEVRSFLGLAAGTEGTGSRAQLDRYRVIGKTGTARNVVDGRYTGTYTSSFAGLFPADDPQLVVVVRIVDPRSGEYYGGLVAAPLTRRMLQDALAARRSMLDRTRFAERAPVTGAADREDAETAPPAPVQVSFPLVRRPAAARPYATIPELAGRSVRQAAMTLHRRGFRVELGGTGIVSGTEPAAGDSARQGSVVVVRTR
jgi:cell division protein FtsI (penicillin-binding protein 3)